METVRSYWQSGILGLYQRLSLKSFADRGCRVEVFTYDPSADLPRWIVRRDAAEVLPPERVLRFLPGRGRFAVNIDLFRYALLAKFGGWWIDPDVVLLADELPADDIFLAGPDEAGLLSTAVLRLPPQHPVAVIAEEFAAANAGAIETWHNAAAPYLTDLAERHGLSSLYRPHAMLAPVSWSHVPKMFEPLPVSNIVALLNATPFLDLHYDAWLQAGLPAQSAPPIGSLLHHLLQRHHIDVVNCDHMDYGDLAQQMARMYAQVSSTVENDQVISAISAKHV